MSEERTETTADSGLLASARAEMPGTDDDRLVDEALAVLCRRRDRTEIDRQYEAYDAVPLDAPDAWGDVESFLSARRGR